MNVRVLTLSKLIAFITLLLFSTFAEAQKRELDQKNIPSVILTAIQSDFPTWSMDNTKWYSYDRATSEWAPMKGDFDSYVVEAKGKGYTIRAIYDETGKLRYSKATMKNAALPTAITQKIAADEAYQGWTITGNQEVIRNFKEDQKTYKVTLAKDGKKKTVYFDRMGNEKKRPFLGELND
ncbi:MAG: hypothetical protein ACQETE_00695 [Bacteroidota bacterium]